MTQVLPKKFNLKLTLRSSGLFCSVFVSTASVRIIASTRLCLAFFQRGCVRLELHKSSLLCWGALLHCLTPLDPAGYREKLSIICKKLEVI